MSVHTWSTAQTGRQLRELMAKGDASTTKKLLDSLFADAATMLATNDLARIARAQGHVARWQAAFADAQSSLVGPPLELLATTLDAGWRTISLQADAQQRSAATTTLRQQVVDLLRATPDLRPSEIARRLGRDPAQINRAVRILVRTGALDRHVPDGHDQRAVTYAPAAAIATPTLAA